MPFWSRGNARPAEPKKANGAPSNPFAEYGIDDADLAPDVEVPDEAALAASAALAGAGGDDEADVELTEEDLRDPELLSQLKELGYESEEGETPAKDKEAHESTPAKARPAAAAASAGPSADEIAELRRLEMGEAAAAKQEHAEACALLAKRIAEYKAAALAHKDAGQMPVAKQLLVRAKELQAMADDAATGLPVDAAKIPGPPPAVGAPAAATPQTGGAPAARKSLQPPAAQGTGGRSPSPQTAKSPSPQPAKTPSPAPPSPTPAAAGKGKGQARGSSIEDDLERELAKRAPVLAGGGDVYDRLEAALLHQIEVCQEKAKEFYGRGEKEMAVKYYMEKKKALQDIDAIRTARQHGDPPPRFHYEDRTQTTTRVFSNLHDDEMELVIVAANNIRPPAGWAPKDLEVFVQYELAFPNADAPQKGTTRVVKGTAHPEFESSHKLQIDRRKPPQDRFAKFIKKKRGVVTFEVIHQKKSGFGLLQKDVPLGHAEVPLEALATAAECRLSAEVLDGKKPTGGRINVILRVREPLLGKDVQTVTERWVVIEGYGTSGAQPATGAPAPQASVAVPPQALTAQPSPVAAAPKQTAAPAASAAPTAQPAAAASKKPAAAAAAEDDDDLDDPHSVDNMESNEVLEHELGVVTARIAALQAARKPVPEDLTDRKQQIELKLQLLVINVQTGQLTMDGYLARLRARVAADKKLALRLKDKGRVDDAKAVMARIKMMTAEIEGAEAGEGEG